MTRKLGMVTVGQSPRTDIVPEMIEAIGQSVQGQGGVVTNPGKGGEKARV